MQGILGTNADFARVLESILGLSGMYLKPSSSGPVCESEARGAVTFCYQILRTVDVRGILISVSSFFFVYYYMPTFTFIGDVRPTLNSVPIWDF